MDQSPNKDSSPFTSAVTSEIWLRAYRKYFRFWVNMAKTTNLSEDDAKDVVQGVLTSIMASSEKEFQSIEHIRNYVARGVLNRAIQAKHKQDRKSSWDETFDHRFPAEPEPSAFDQAERKEVLKNAILRLSKKDSEIIKLRFFAGLTFLEISKILGTPISTLKSREDAAIQKLKKALRKMGYSDVL